MKHKMKLLRIFCILFLLFPFFAFAEDHKHSVKDWTVIEEATCLSQGSKVGYCSGCGKKVFRVIEEDNHAFGDWTQSRANVRMRTCGKCGATCMEYVLAPEKDTPMLLKTTGPAQQIVFTFPEEYAGDILMTLPAGEETEILFHVPGGRTEIMSPEMTETGGSLTLPKEKERISVRLAVQKREGPFPLVIHKPAEASGALTISLPSFTAAAEMSWKVYAGKTVTVTVTGQDAGKTDVRPVVPELNPTLVSGDVIELSYPEPILSDAQAKELFSVTVGGEEAEWEFLSYFEFGPYAERGGIVSLRLIRALDVGLPAMYAGKTCISPSSQEENGAAAAASVHVSMSGKTEETVFKPFWSEIRYMEETGAAVWVAAGAEDEDIPEIENSLTVHLLGKERSVYEDPDYRGLYTPGETNDTFARSRILGEEGYPVTVRPSKG